MEQRHTHNTSVEVVQDSVNLRPRGYWNKLLHVIMFYLQTTVLLLVPLKRIDAVSTVWLAVQSFLSWLYFFYHVGNLCFHIYLRSCITLPITVAALRYLLSSILRKLGTWVSMPPMVWLVLDVCFSSCVYVVLWSFGLTTDRFSDQICTKYV